MSDVQYPVSLIQQQAIEKFDRTILDAFETGTTTSRRQWAANSFKRKVTVGHAPLLPLEYRWLKSFHTARGTYDYFWYRDNVTRAGNLKVRFTGALKHASQRMVIGVGVDMEEVAPLRINPELDEMATAAGSNPVFWWDANREVWISHCGTTITELSAYDAVLESYRPVWQTPVSPLLSQLVAYWKLDEASGTRADSRGSNNLADHNSTGNVAGKLGNASNFVAGSVNYHDIASNADLAMGTNDFTFGGWINWPSLPGSQQDALSKWGGGTQEYMLYYNGGLNWIVKNTGGTSYVASQAISAATWYYFLAWWDSTNNQVGLMVNNGAAVTTATTGTIKNDVNAFALGAGAGGVAPATVKLDSVACWRRLLTTAEKTALYNSGNGLEYPF